jgi:uncharacterized protein YbaR (Trm112 family)
MLDEGFIGELVCPENRQRLKRADSALIAQLNQRIAAGNVKNRSGQIVREPLGGGLLREDGQVLYPVRDDIPEMLVEEAITLGPES